MLSTINVSIAPRGPIGIADDRLAPAADVAGKHQAMRRGAGDLHLDIGAAENVSRVAIRHREVVGDRERALVRVGFHQFHRTHGVGHRVERRGTVAGASPLLAGSESRSPGCAPRRAASTRRDRAWRAWRRSACRTGAPRAAAGGPNDRCGRGSGRPRRAAADRTARDALSRAASVAVALEEAAVEQHPATVPFEQVTRAGDLAGGAPERDCDAHDTSPLTKMSGSLAASARR